MVNQFREVGMGGWDGWRREEEGKVNTPKVEEKARKKGALGGGGGGARNKKKDQALVGLREKGELTNGGGDGRSHTRGGFLSLFGFFLICVGN